MLPLSQSAPQAARLAYLFSRYPVPSQSFCDFEMMGLQEHGAPTLAVSLNPPATTFRRWPAEVFDPTTLYPPPSAVLKVCATEPEFEATMGACIADHDRRYGSDYKAAIRARNAWYAARALKQRGIHHVHVHFMNRATHTAVFMRELGITYSVTAHAQDFMVDLGSDELLAEICEKSEFVIAVSDFSRQLLADRCPDSADKIERLYNGIDVSRFDTLPRDLPRAADSPMRIVTVGRLVAFKGFDQLVEACRLLRQRGIDVACEILGEGPQHRELNAQIVAADLSDSVRLHGVVTQDEIRSQLAEADVFALPSLVDGKGASDILPTVIIEAMAAGLPIVSTTLAGIPEMVGDEEGILVPPGEAPPLADALGRLAADPALGTKMGLAGRERAARDFNFHHTSKALLQRLEPHLADEISARAKLAYLVGSWDGQPGEVAQAIADPEILVVICTVDSGFSNKAGVDLSRVLFLPDAAALESCWLADARWREICEELRDSVPGAPDGETFFRKARRAAYLKRALAGIPHLHAYRSDTALLAHLLPNPSKSYTVEPSPDIPPKSLAHLIELASHASVADPKVAQLLDDEFPDALGLAPPERKKIQVGPIRIKYRAKIDHSLEQLHADWLATLKTKAQETAAKGSKP